MSSVAILPSLLPILVVAAMRRAEKRIYRQLSDANAYTSDTAIALPSGGSMVKRRLQSLIRAGAVREVGNDRYFLDSGCWNTYRNNRQQRAIFAATIAVAAVGIAIALILALQ